MFDVSNRNLSNFKQNLRNLKQCLRDFDRNLWISIKVLEILTEIFDHHPCFLVLLTKFKGKTHFDIIFLKTKKYRSIYHCNFGTKNNKYVDFMLSLPPLTLFSAKNGGGRLRAPF